MFNNAPKLKSVVISGSPTATARWLLDVDTRSLEHLYVGMGSVIHNVRSAPGFGFSKLTTLEMWDRGILDYSELADDEVTLEFPALRSLTYQCSDWFNPDERFLLLPVAPRLEQLSITAARGDIANLLIDLHRRSTARAGHGHPLKLLYLRGDLSYSFDRDYIKVLQLFPSLETLDINFPAAQVIHALSIVGMDGTYLIVPSLKRCSFLFRGDNFDEVRTAVTQLASARCERSPLIGRQKQQLFELCIHVHYRRELRFGPRQRPGFGVNDWVHLALQPTRLEPWYGFDKQVLRSAYSDVYEAIPKVLLNGYGQVDTASFDYRNTLQLIDCVERRYNSAELVELLETNTNVALISAAYFFKTKMPASSKKENSIYRRVVRLLRHVRKDILDKLQCLSFHWIWESSRDKIWIRYIADEDKVRADPEGFANAILGISDDMWVLDDF